MTSKTIFIIIALIVMIALILVVWGVLSPVSVVIPSPEKITTTFNLKPLEELQKLKFKIHGKLPLEIKAEEVGRENPFIPY